MRISPSGCAARVALGVNHPCAMLWRATPIDFDKRHLIQALSRYLAVYIAVDNATLAAMKRAQASLIRGHHKA